MNENSEAFSVLSMIAFFSVFDHGIATLVRYKIIRNITMTIGWIKSIKLLSPIPIEFITIASESLYKRFTARMIAKKKERDRISGISLIMLKPTTGSKSDIGMPASILSLNTKAS
jgi:hypothetical protein